MARAATFGVFLLLGAVAAEGGVEVRLVGERVDVRATTTPLSEVLDALATPLRIKVVYDGPRPRPTVSVSLQGRTPVEAVVGIMEGLGINYALTVDANGSRVTTLLVMAPAGEPGTPAGAPTRGASSPRGPVERFRDLKERAPIEDAEADAIVGPDEGEEPPIEAPAVPKPDTGSQEALPPDSFAGATGAAIPSAPTAAPPATQPTVPPSQNPLSPFGPAAPVVFPTPAPAPANQSPPKP